MSQTLRHPWHDTGCLKAPSIVSLSLYIYGILCRHPPKKAKKRTPKGFDIDQTSRSSSRFRVVDSENVFVFSFKLSTSNKCITTSNKKPLGTSASLLVTRALLLVTRSY